MSCDFVYDDWTILVNNTHLNPPTWAAFGYYWNHVTVNLYMPITGMAWELVTHLAYVPVADASGNHLNPAVFHLANVLIHCAGALALYRLLFLLVGNRWAAAIGSLVFGIHPLQVEPVTFIGTINNPLLGLFSFLALGDYIDALRKDKPLRNVAYFRGMLFLVLAMLSKPTAVVVPPMAFVLDLAIRRRPRAAVRSILPYVALIVPCMIWTRHFQSGAVAQNMAPTSFRPVIVFDTIAFYILKILMPLRLCEDYGRTPGLLYNHPWLAAQGLVTLGMIIFGWIVRRRAPLVSAAIFAFIAALIPTSGLASFEHQQYSTVADRYAYLAMLGPSLLLAWGLSRTSARHRLPVAVTVAVVLLALSARTIHQIGYWRDDRALFGHTLEINPDSWMGYSNLAYSLLQIDPAAAIKAAQGAIRVRPNSASPHTTIATADFLLGDRSEGIRQLRVAIALNPNDSAAHKVLAAALDKTGDVAGALQEYHRCLELDPTDAAVHSDLAALLADNGHLQDAIDQYQLALAINSHFENAVVGLAMAQRQLHEKPPPP